MEIMPEMDRRSFHEDRVSYYEVDLIKSRDSHTALRFKLSNGDIIEGAIRWFDERALRIVRPDRTEVTVYMHAIIYFENMPK